MTENEINEVPTWDVLGEPENLTAAAMDAANWLRFLAHHMPNVFDESTSRRERPRLLGCLSALERFVPDEFGSTRVLAEMLGGESIERLYTGNEMRLDFKADEIGGKKAERNKRAARCWPWRCGSMITRRAGMGRRQSGTRCNWNHEDDRR